MNNAKNQVDGKHKRFLFITICFLPIAFIVFMIAVMGDCTMEITARECGEGKDAALRTSMACVGVAYAIVLALPMLRRRMRTLLGRRRNGEVD
ncbi:MAG: hypothetical protein V4564_25195 [Pseudomonadota bacterium]